MTLDELRTICVTNFPLSRTRIKIMSGLEYIFEQFRKERISQQFWVDGSFMTEKIDPSDVDIVLPFHNEAYNNLKPNQLKVIQWYTGENLRPNHKVDNYHFFEYSQDDSDFEIGQAAREYWLNMFGTDRDGFKKGIAVITA